MSASRAAPTAHESDLMRAYQEAIPYALPHVRVFRRNIMAAHLSGGHYVKAGIPGQCDLYTYVRRKACPVDSACEYPLPCPYCMAFAIETECKSATAEWTPKQKAWRAFCEEWRIPYLALEAKRDETPGQTVNRWVDETRELVGRLT